MAHVLPGFGRQKTLTLDASNRQLLTVLGGDALTGQWLELVWVDQNAANLVYVEALSGLADNAARGADARKVHPGTSFRALIPIGEGLPIYVSGSSAFDVTVIVHR